MKGKAVARLTKEIKAVRKELPPGVLDMYLDDNDMHNLYFLLAGPEDTPYAGGIYILKLQLPKDYPFSAPDFLMLTPNGRFATSTKICTTFSAFHPETWTPSYTLTTLLISFLSFFVDNGVAAGAINTSAEEKRRFAEASVKWNKRHQLPKEKFTTILPILQHMQDGLQTADTIKQAMQKRYPEAQAQAQPDAARAATQGQAAASAAGSSSAPHPAPQIHAAPAGAGPAGALAQAQPAAHGASMDLTSAAAPGRLPLASRAQVSPGKHANKRRSSTDMVVLDGALPSKKAAPTVAAPPIAKTVAAASDTIDLT